MFEGKITDVIVEHNEILNYIEVWADEGVEELIAEIEGITWVYHDPIVKTEYHVYIDPRYDVEWLMKEIEAKIKIGK
jgi:hypothetical protein